MATVTKPILLDETGKSIVEALKDIKQLMDDGSIVIPGPEGPTGPAAGFGKITAQVDDISDDLSVEVSTSGPNDALNIDFMFHGLRSNSNSIQYMFSVNDEGHLILNYTGDEAPNFSIKEDGHLYLNI